MIRILHLTDFHLNDKTLRDWNDFMKEPFLTKISCLNTQKKIDLVLFTGDLIDKAGFDFGSVSEGLNTFKENIIEPILKILDLDVSKFIICPGNHDINRNADKDYVHNGLKSKLTTIDSINAFTNEPETDYEGIQRIKDYKNFEFELYKNIEKKLHSKFKFSTIIEVDGKQIGVSSLNSSWRCYGDDDMKNILLGESQLNDNFLYVKNCDIKIALMHHQLDWLSEIEAKNIKAHISANYDLIFSGHVHQSDVELVKNLTGTSLRIVSPSGLNQIRQNDSNYTNGFSVVDYGSEYIKCYFFKYSQIQRKFSPNFEIGEEGILSIELNNMASNHSRINQIILEEEFEDFLNDSGANFTHRSKTLYLDDIYVHPFVEQFSLKEEEDKNSSIRSEIVVSRILNNEFNNIFILGEENCGKTAFCKKIFKEIYNKKEKTPIYIKGRDIKKSPVEDIVKLINKKSRRDYKNLDLKLEDTVIIIDDFNNCSLPKKSKVNILNFLLSKNIQTIITWDEYFTLSELLESQLSKFEVFELLKFGARKRQELIERWIDLIEDEFEDEQSKQFQIKELSRMVNTIIGKNLIPSLPIYILTILQANEITNTSNFEQSTFGHYYDVLIRSALGQRIRVNAEIEKYYSYLTELSFWLYNKKVIEIEESQFIEFHTYFTQKYRVPLSFRDSISILEDSNIIQKNILFYKFKYKYIYFYFIGKYFSDTMDSFETQNIVTELSNKLYQTEAANIYIFLSHHSKSKFVINQILERAKELFNNELVIGFNKDVEAINNLINETTQKIEFIDETISEIDEEVSEFDIEVRDFEEVNEQELIGGEKDFEIDSISKVNKAFKTIEILGYIIKNRYASLSGTDKLELVEELYKLGLRSLTFLFKTLLSGGEYIKNEIIEIIKKDPNSALTSREREELAKQFIFNLLYMVSYSIFKRISSSISSRDLEMTFQDVYDKLIMTQTGEKNNAISLIDIAIIFEYSKSFPESDVKKLSEEFNRNHLAFSILRRLGVNFMRMIPMKETEQQKASEMLNISVQRQRIIGATSPIKK